MCIKLIIVLIFFAQIECMENTEISKAQEFGQFQITEIRHQPDFKAKPFNTVPEPLLTDILQLAIADHIGQLDTLQDPEERIKPFATIQKVCKRWNTIFKTNLMGQIANALAKTGDDLGWIKPIYYVPTINMFELMVQKDINTLVAKEAAEKAEKEAKGPPKPRANALLLPNVREAARKTKENKIRTSTYTSLMSKTAAISGLVPNQFYKISESLAASGLIVDLISIIEPKEWSHSCKIIKLFHDDAHDELTYEQRGVLQQLFWNKCRQQPISAKIPTVIEDINILFDLGCKFNYDCLWRFCSRPDEDLAVMISGIIKNMDDEKRAGVMNEVCCANKLMCVKVLLAERVLIWDSILYKAVHGRANKVIHYLIDNKKVSLSIARSSDYEMTPLYVACSMHQLDMVKYLVDNGADVNELAGIAGQNRKESPLQVAKQKVKTFSCYSPESNENQQEIIDFLIWQGAVDVEENKKELKENQNKAEIKKESIKNKESLIMRFVGLIERANTGDLAAMVMLIGGAAILGLVYGELRDGITDAISSYFKTSPLTTE